MLGPGFLFDEADTDLDKALALALANAGVRYVALNAATFVPAAIEILRNPPGARATLA